MEQTRKRELWIDTLKAAAVFIVFTTHFISRFHSEYFVFWSVPPTSYILKGITGKACVSLLGVIAGLFAYRSEEKNPTVYILKRWAFFFVSGLMINLIRVVLGEIGLMKQLFEDHSLLWKAGKIMIESITIGDGIYATYWCMLPIFAASVFSYLNRRANTTIVAIIIQIAVMIILRQIWIAVCMLGTLAGRAEQDGRIKTVFSKRIFQIAFIVLAFFAVKRPESELTYMIDGLVSAGLLLIIANNVKVQKVLNNRFTASIGKRVVAVFLIHVIIYNIIGVFVIELTSGLPYKFSFLTAFVISWITILLISRPVLATINFLTGLLTGLMKKDWMKSVKMS